MEWNEREREGGSVTQVMNLCKGHRFVVIVRAQVRQVRMEWTGDKQRNRLSLPLTLRLGVDQPTRNQWKATRRGHCPVTSPSQVNESSSSSEQVLTFPFELRCSFNGNDCKIKLVKKPCKQHPHIGCGLADAIWPFFVV